MIVSRGKALYNCGMRLFAVLLTLVVFVGEAYASPAERQFDGSRTHFLNERGLESTKGVHRDASGRQHKYRVRSKSVTKGEGANKKTYSHYFFEYVVEGASTKLIARWNSKDESAREYAPLGIRLSKEGQAYAVVRVTHGPKDDRTSDILWFRSGRSMKTLMTDEDWGKGRLLLGTNDEPLFFWRSDREVWLYAGAKKRRLMERSMYDWSVARLANGEVYLLAHDYRDRSLVAHMAKEGTWDWKEAYIDTQESGWQHSIAITDSQLFVAYYFYRNSFNKGVRIAQLADYEVEATETYHREKDFNSGWEPALAISASNEVRFSFLVNVSEEKQRTDSYPSAEALMKYAAENDHAYVEGWEDTYRDWFVFGGPELAYQFWNVLAPTPSTSDAPKQFDASYDYNPSLVARGMLEARWGTTNIGVNYTQNLIADSLEDEFGTNAKRAFNFIGGFIGFERLFLGQDVRVSVGAGEFQGAYTDQNGTRSTPTELYEFELNLLNQYRTRLGVSFRQYDLRQPIYKYFAADGATEYEFTDSAVVDASVRRFDLVAGYSKLDYLSKYENHFNGLDVEVKIGGGLSFMSWDEVQLGMDDESFSLQPTAMGQLRLVYLYFKRFYSLHGLGMYFRAGYGADLFFNGFIAGKPDERDDTDDELNSDSVLRAVHYQLQHGPFLGFGLVY